MKIAFISDIHEDVVALKIAIELINNEKCDKIICLGDIVGFDKTHYCHYQTKNANECINIIKKECAISIAGNHDLHLSKRFPPVYKDYNIPKNWYELDINKKEKIANNQIWLYKKEINANLNANSINFLNDLPIEKVLETKNRKILLTHFLYPDLTGSSTFFPSEQYDYISHLVYLKSKNCNISFTGHGHVEGTAFISDKKAVFYDFGIKKIRKKTKIVLCPSLSGGTRRRGFLIFDDETNELITFEF